MVVGQKVGYARVNTSGQDLGLQLDKLSDCDRIFQEKVSWAISKSDQIRFQVKRK